MDIAFVGKYNKYNSRDHEHITHAKAIASGDAGSDMSQNSLVGVGSVTELPERSLNPGGWVLCETSQSKDIPRSHPQTNDNKVHSLFKIIGKEAKWVAYKMIVTEHGLAIVPPIGGCSSSKKGGRRIWKRQTGEYYLNDGCERI